MIDDGEEKKEGQQQQQFQQQASISELTHSTEIVVPYHAPIAQICNHNGTPVDTSTLSCGNYNSPRKRSLDETLGQSPPVVLPSSEQHEEYDCHDDIAASGSTGNSSLPKRAHTSSEQDVSASSTLSPNRQWNIMFDLLQAYKAKNGDCLVPKRFSEDPKLGTWVETQRVQYKRLHRQLDETSGVEVVQPNKRLTPERLDKLEEIGFAWSGKHARKITETRGFVGVVSGTPTRKAATQPQSGDRPGGAARSWNDTQWEEMFQRLVQYKRVHGDCLVPRKFDQDPKLATWVETQRVIWNRDHRNARAPAVHSFAHEWAGDIQDWNMEGVGKDASDEGSEFEEDEVVAAAAAAAAEAVDADLKVVAHPSYGKKLTRERMDKLDALGFVWSLRSKRTEDHWDQMFRQLVDYKESKGDCLVPSRYEENMKLGKWVETQRYEYTKLQRAINGKDVSFEPSEDSKPRASNPRLTLERSRKLESIGFEWKVRNKMKRYYDKQWQDMFDRLLRFKRETGHCMVPKRHPPDFKLGTWVHTQRIQHRKLLNGASKKDEAGSNGEGDQWEEGFSKMEEDMSSRLTEERKKRLDEVGFVWSARENDIKTDQRPRLTRNSYDDLWDAMFDRLVAFKETHGHCLVPKRFSEDQKLGTWVDTQRVQYKKKAKKVSDDSERLRYDSDSNSAKDEGESVTVNGLSPVSAGPTKPLLGRLTNERIHRLEALGFVWSLRDDWIKHYEELKAYKEEFGNCNVPARYTENRRLGIWVSAQRQQHKILHSGEGYGNIMSPDARKTKPPSLTPERIALLDQLGFSWTIRSRDALGESWNQKLSYLKEYKTKHGHCLVPSRYPPNPELGIWVGTQRTQYRLYQKAKDSGQSDTGEASAMSQERIQQLEELGFVWALRGTEGNRRETPVYNRVESIGEGSNNQEEMTSWQHGPQYGKQEELAMEERVTLDL